VPFELGRGAVTRLVVYMDRDRALADLDVSPEADSRCCAQQTLLAITLPIALAVAKALGVYQ